MYTPTRFKGMSWSTLVTSKNYLIECENSYHTVLTVYPEKNSGLSLPRKRAAGVFFLQFEAQSVGKTTRDGTRGVSKRGTCNWSEVRIYINFPSDHVIWEGGSWQPQESPGGPPPPPWCRWHVISGLPDNLSIPHCWHEIPQYMYFVIARKIISLRNLPSLISLSSL